QVADGYVRATQDLNAVVPFGRAGGDVAVRVPVADQLATGNFHLRAIARQQDVRADCRICLGLQDRLWVHAQQHVAAQLDVLCRIDQVGTGRDDDRATSGGQCIDRGLE